MADPRTPRTPLEQYVARIKAIEVKLEEMGRPSGGAINQTSTKVGGTSVQSQIDALSTHLEEDLALEALLRDQAIAVAITAATGAILTSPNGTRWRLGVSDAGSTTWTVVTS